MRNDIFWLIFWKVTLIADWEYTIEEARIKEGRINEFTITFPEKHGMVWRRVVIIYVVKKSHSLDWIYFFVIFNLEKFYTYENIIWIV